MEDIENRQRILEKRRTSRVSPYASDQSNNSYNRNYHALGSHRRIDNSNRIPLKPPSQAIDNPNHIPLKPPSQAKMPTQPSTEETHNVTTKGSLQIEKKPKSTHLGNPTAPRIQPDGDRIMEDEHASPANSCLSARLYSAPSKTLQSPLIYGANKK